MLKPSSPRASMTSPIETAARSDAAPVRAARPAGAAQARGPAAGLLVQDPRRLQQDRGADARRQRARGVICASAGNHAQGVALAARELGIAATIVMPTTTPAIKVEAVRRAGRRRRAARRRLRRGLRRGARAARPRPGRCRSSTRSTIPTSSPARARSAWRSCASIPSPIDADLRADRRRRAGGRRRRLRQVPAARDQGHRRRAGRRGLA